VHLMIVAISRFTQLIKVLPLLKLMDQSRHGVFRVQVRPLILDTLRLLQILVGTIQSIDAGVVPPRFE
jgi:hypothetical protein